MMHGNTKIKLVNMIESVMQGHTNIKLVTRLQCRSEFVLCSLHDRKVHMYTQPV